MSNNYWIDRFTAEENRINELSKEQVKEAKRQYDIALKNVNQKIYEFYAKYAKDNNISMYEAKQRFNKKELKEFKMSLSEYVRKGQSLNISPNDNIVKELSRSYDIKSIEFKKIEKTYEAGSITLYIKINDDSEYETTISIDNMDELNNIKTRWGLSPIQRFEKIKRNERLPLERVDIRSIKIKYIQE